MATIKPTGAALADQIRGHEYDANFLMGFLVTFVGHVADKETSKPPHVAAREVLEKLADFDTFVADIPIAGTER